MLTAKQLKKTNRRGDDTIDEPGWRHIEPRRQDVNHNCDPGDDACKAAEPERQPARLARFFILLLQRPEQYHASIDAEDGQQGSNVADAGDLRD